MRPYVLRKAGKSEAEGERADGEAWLNGKPILRHPKACARDFGICFHAIRPRFLRFSFSWRLAWPLLCALSVCFHFYSETVGERDGLGSLRHGFHEASSAGVVE